MASSRPEAVNMDQALLDPGSIFKAPEDVLSHAALAREQKIEILRRWEYDAAEMCVAIEEGMPGDESGLLGRILLALNQLTGGVDTERAGPSKQHGLDRGAMRRRTE